MLLCAVGDIHGAIDRMYDDVLSFEASLGVRFEWILHVGDFGIWPDPKRIDRAAKKHDGAGDFPAWLADRRVAPRKTVFIKGNHEDFVWLDAQPIPEILPGLFYLRNGRTMNLGESGDIVQIGGVGGCYSPSDFERQSKHLQGYAKRHCAWTMRSPASDASGSTGCVCQAIGWDRCGSASAPVVGSRRMATVPHAIGGSGPEST